jgi:predicted dehydrogenase
LIGCGAISGQYLWQCRRFPGLSVVACADLNPAAAEAVGKQFAIPTVFATPADLLADQNVDLVLNLTNPNAHAEVSLAALRAGKHVYVEKPLGISRAEGIAVMDEARRRNLRVGCAPDTFMGSAIQTARRALDDGRIGRPLGFTAFMMCPGHESWHPNPEFYYQIGGGPMFDMGPYYLTALLNFLGPVKRLCGIASIAIPQRTIKSQPKMGKKIEVQTPDHIAGLMEFDCGAVGTIIQSFAAYHAPNAVITIFGDQGTMELPDPNQFSGVVKARGKDESDWTPLPAIFAHDYGRGVGLADMAAAIGNGRSFRASGDQGLAVLDAMQGFLDSSNQGIFHQPSVAYQRPAPMPIDAEFGQFN